MAKYTGEVLQEYEFASDGKLMLRRIFPSAFTLAQILLFLVPTYLLVHAASNPVVEYWHGEWYYVLCVIPVIIFVVHLYHNRNGPDRYITNLSLLFPSALLFVFGMNMLTNAILRGDKLFSLDCDSMTKKAYLQYEWEAAHKFYGDCLKDSAKERNLTRGYLAKNFRIQDCIDYKSALLDHWHSWRYLRYLEEEHDCTGFCEPGEQLWSKGRHKDACTIAVASTFKYIVKTSCTQVVAISLITLCLEAVAISFLGPTVMSSGMNL